MGFVIYGLILICTILQLMVSSFYFACYLRWGGRLLMVSSIAIVLVPQLLLIQGGDVLTKIIALALSSIAVWLVSVLSRRQLSQFDDLESFANFDLIKARLLARKNGGEHTVPAGEHPNHPSWISIAAFGWPTIYPLPMHWQATAAVGLALVVPIATVKFIRKPTSASS